MKTRLLALAAILVAPAFAAFTASGTYDEQSVQTNAVDHSMAYSGNTTWTTGVGLTLGAAQIRTVAEFKPWVEAAFLTGNGGVITFDGVNNADYSQVQSFAASFAGGTKGMTLTNRIDGNYSVSGPSGDRTAISGSQFLTTGGNAHFDFDFTSFTGFGPNEKITAVGVTILGRSGQGTGRNFRVVARYTNGVETGSSSTFRTFDMQAGNTTQDSFSGIVAPAGFWITSIRAHSDNGIFTALDDLAFITSDVIPVAPEIVADLDPSYAPYLGDMLTLGVTLAPGASPPPAYQWYLNDVEIDALDGGKNPTLEIIAGASTDGAYKVVVTNSAGSDESSTVVAHTTNPALADWFKAYRCRVLDTRGGINTLQISEFVLSYDGSPLTGGTATNPGGNNPANEGPANARDGNTATKWLDSNKQPLVVTFPARRAVGAYNFATANDVPERDPVSWFVEGSNDGFTWVPLHAVFNHPTTTERFTYAAGFILPADRDDIDEDGMDDDWEILHFGNLRQESGGDLDGDGATNLQEYQTAQGILIQRDIDGKITSLSPFSGSSDPTNPNSQPDSDHNGLPDPWEIKYFQALGQSPTADPDMDGLTNLQELIAGTDPTKTDTDGDGISDGDEVTAGTNPLWASFLREWRPGGLAANGGIWDATVPNWYDGHSATPGFGTWSPGFAARFAGNLSSALTVDIQAAITGINGLNFTHTGTANWTLQNGSLAFSDPTIRFATRGARVNSQIISPTGLDIRSTGGGGLILGGNNTGALAGTITVHPDATLDPIAGNTALGSAAVMVKSGGQLRLFAPELVFYTRPVTIQGFGTTQRADGAGAIRGGGGTHTREFDEPILLAGDAGIRLDGGQTLGAFRGIALATGVTAADLYCALDGGAVLNIADDLLLGDGLLRVSPLPVANGTSAGGTVVLGGPDNAFAGVLISQGTLRADAEGTLPPGIPVTLDGGTVLLNGTYNQTIASITGTGGTFDAGAADLTAPVIGGTGGAVSIGTGSFTLAMTGDITTGRMIRTTNVAGSLFTKQGNHRLTLTGTDNRGGGANGNWVIAQGILDLAANQPQFGTVRDGGTVTVMSGASVMVSHFNALHGWDGGGTHYILEAGASMTTGPEITTRATRITLKGGELASGTPNPVFGSYDLFGNTPERRLIADGGAVTSVISAQDIRLATPAGYIFETMAGTSPSGIDLDVTGTLNGAHGLIKQGEGVMRLGASVHGYEGNTVVAAGTLRLAGSIPSSPLIRVDAGASLDVSPSYAFGAAQTLAGAGTITGSISGAGTIAPGASTGTLTIIGSADLTGTTLAIEINDEASPANNSLAVGGLLDLAGATIDFAVTGVLTAPAYVIATYGTLAGQGNVTVLDLPDGYSLDFGYHSGTAVALVAVAGDNYETWAAANGIAGQPFGGDFDNDGLSNGLEYALAGLNPTAPDGFPGSFENGTLTFTKRPEALANGDVSYAIVTSTTLADGSWTTVTPDANNATTISYTLPAGQGRIFARLVVTFVP